MTAARKTNTLKARTPRVKLARIVEPEPPPKAKRTRIVWTEDERIMLIEAGAEIVRADITGRLSYIQALKRAVIRLAGKVRHRPLAAVSPAQYAWFREGVEARIKAIAPPREPEPIAVVEPASELDDIRLVISNLSEVVGKVVETLADIAKRLGPVEKIAIVTQKALFAVVNSLDPALLATFDEPPPSVERNGHVEPLPAPMPPKPPRARICIVGLRPDAQRVVREKINGRATLTFILDPDKALRKGFAPYDGVVITRHVNHEVQDKALMDLDKRHVARLEVTSANKVIEQVERFAEMHAREHKPKPVGV